MVLVGEQPGDKEDLEGRPFVGPAGHLLDDALIGGWLIGGWLIGNRLIGGLLNGG